MRNKNSFLIHMHFKWKLSLHGIFLVNQIHLQSHNFPSLSKFLYAFVQVTAWLNNWQIKWACNLDGGIVSLFCKSVKRTLILSFAASCSCSLSLSLQWLSLCFWTFSSWSLCYSVTWLWVLLLGSKCNQQMHSLRSFCAAKSFTLL